MKWKMQKEYVNAYIKGNVISFLVDKQANQNTFAWNWVICMNKYTQITIAGGHICTVQLDKIIKILANEFSSLRKEGTVKM